MDDQIVPSLQIHHVVRLIALSEPVNKALD